MAKHQKNNLEILHEIRERRLEQLQSKGKNDTSIPMVRFIGEGENSKQRIFQLIEQIDGEEGKQYEERFYAFDENTIKLIAVRNEQTDGELFPIAPQSEFDTIKEEIEQCLEERDELLKQVAEKLGLSHDEIDNLSEIDLEQKIIDEEKADKSEEPKEENEENKLTEEQANSLDSLNELDVNTQVDSRGTTIGKSLNLDELGYTKILIVHAHKLSEINTEREDIKFGLVGVKSDGTKEAVPTDKIRMYRGDNTEIVNIKNPQEITTNSNGYAFEVVGTNRKLVIDQANASNRPEVYLAQASRDNDGNVAQKLPDKYEGKERTDIEVRDLYSGYHGEDQIENSYNEAKTHEEVGCDDLNLEEVDGDETTGHKHLENGEIKEVDAQEAEIQRTEIIQEIATKCRVSEKTAELYYNEVILNEETLTREEIVDRAQDIDAQAIGAPTREH